MCTNARILWTILIAHYYGSNLRKEHWFAHQKHVNVKRCDRKMPYQWFQMSVYQSTVWISGSHAYSLLPSGCPSLNTSTMFVFAFTYRLLSTVEGVGYGCIAGRLCCKVIFLAAWHIGWDEHFHAEPIVHEFFWSFYFFLFVYVFLFFQSGRGEYHIDLIIRYVVVDWWIRWIPGAFCWLEEKILIKLENQD